MPDRSKNPGKRLLALAQEECRTLHAALEQRQDASASVHEARTAIRRLRSLFALAEDRVDGLVNLDRSLDRLGKGLSALRDAHVVVATARKLAAMDSTVPWAAFIEALVRRHDAMLARDTALDPGFGRRRRVARRIERALETLDWSPLRAIDVRSALKRSQRRSGRAGRRAKETPTPENMHCWRRRMRRLRMQLEAVRKARPDIAKAVAKRSLRKELKDLHEVSDELGWQQDLEVLRDRIGQMKTAPDRMLLSQHVRATLGMTHPGGDEGATPHSG